MDTDNVLSFVDSEPHMTFTSEITGERYFISESDLIDILNGDIDPDDVIEEENRDDLFVAVLAKACNELL